MYIEESEIFTIFLHDVEHREWNSLFTTIMSNKLWWNSYLLIMWYWSDSFIDFSAKYAELTANHWQKKSLLFTQNLTKPKIGDTWSITNYGCPKIVLNNMIFWNLIWSPEIRRQIRPFLVLFKIRTCYLKKIWFGKCAVRFKCTVLWNLKKCHLGYFQRVQLS